MLKNVMVLVFLSTYIRLKNLVVVISVECDSFSVPVLKGKTTVLTWLQKW